MTDAVDHKRQRAALAHELRNSLAAIQGALDLLRLPAAGQGAEQEEMLELIERQVDAIGQITDELLDIMQG